MHSIQDKKGCEDTKEFLFNSSVEEQFHHIFVKKYFPVSPENVRACVSSSLNIFTQWTVMIPGSHFQTCDTEYTCMLIKHDPNE